MADTVLIQLEFIGHRETNSYFAHFVESGDEASRVALVGTNFTVREVTAQIDTKSEPKQVTERGWFGKETTVLREQRNHIVRESALQVKHDGASYLIRGVKFAEYSAILTQAVEQQASRPVVLVDLTAANKSSPSTTLS